MSVFISIPGPVSGMARDRFMLPRERAKRSLKCEATADTPGAFIQHDILSPWSFSTSTPSPHYSIS